MLDKLKRLFRSRGGEVEYRSQTDETPDVVLAGPPTSPYPPAVPIERPDAQKEDDERQ